MASSKRTLSPGATVGVVGGGQLGRYFVLEARRLGYHTWVLDPDAQAPAMQIAEHPEVAAFDDADALERMAKACDAVTIEFENVPAASLDLLAALTRVAPSSESVHIAQDRVREKDFARAAGLQAVPFAVIQSADDIDAAITSIQLPAILKTAQLGYDGKGQTLCESPDDVTAAYFSMRDVCCVLEQRISLRAEVSVVLARGFDGSMRAFPVAENVHVDGVLFTSVVPASVSETVQEEAQDAAKRLAESLDYHGVLGVEFFLADDDTLYFNEMAPRPHNSAHYTLDATDTSQFEQQLRVLAGLPLGSVQANSSVAMLNILGDRWAGGAPDWSALMEIDSAKLHLYGKTESRSGRKMGHVNVLGNSADEVLAKAQSIARNL